MMRTRLLDILICCTLAIGTLACTLQRTNKLDPIVHTYYARDLWFDADVAKTTLLMTDRSVDRHTTTRKHPLISLMLHPPVSLLRQALGMDRIVAVRVVTAAIAALWAAALFTLLRLAGCRRFDSVVFTLVGQASASAMFFLVVPDSFPIGSFTILVALGVAAAAEHRRLTDGWYVFAGGLAMSATITNAMAAVAIAWARHPWRRALQLVANSLALIVVLWSFQKLLYPAAEFFLPWGERQGRFFVASPETHPLTSLKTMVLHGMIIPDVQVTNPGDSGWYLSGLSVFRSAPGSASSWGLLGVTTWILLLVLGSWALLTLGTARRLRIALAITVVGQLALHSVYGIEVFLFSIHVVPLLVVVSALATLTPLRRFALALAGVVIVAATINNGQQYAMAARFVADRVHEANLVNIAREQRPEDDFPRDTGHVLLALPGSPALAKAYHEPGGSFSPSAGSFGISFWIVDEAGTVRASSASIPMSEVRQHLERTHDGLSSSIVTETPYYRVRWSLVAEGQWRMHVDRPKGAPEQLKLLVRSVGPAGGPVRSLVLDAGRLIINGRWVLSFTSPASDVTLGHEGDAGWQTARGESTHWSGADGWGYARLTFPASPAWEAMLEDTKPLRDTTVSVGATRSGLEMQLPDERFARSLEAQVGHLLMGIVGDESRPGDPLAFPFSWSRNEPFVVAALASAGQLAAARQLAERMASRDFAGGFGAEAEAPGLSLWALSEVALRIQQPEYDRWLWPHVLRKADLILQMVAADQAMTRAPEGPIVPSRRYDPNVTNVVEPSNRGLIVSSKGPPSSFRLVNAASFRGLVAAAELAQRVGSADDASRFLAAALRLRDAWSREASGQGARRVEYVPDDSWLADLRTSVFALAAIEGPNVPDRRRRFPMSTRYLALADAHRQVLFGLPRGAWSVLERFWNEQESPGLYTWGEAAGEEASYETWNTIRGGTQRTRITPDYRVAAELLLLQLSMLAYLDESGEEPTIVIGAGIPRAWLDHPLRVRGLSLPRGGVDWEWDGREVRVDVRGVQRAVRLGPSFDAATVIRVRHIGPITER